MTTARQKVLAYFSKARTASPREISRSLKMSPATVRHHLRVLISDGRLESAGVRGGDGKGRPEKLYSLPRHALGHNLAVLSEAVFMEVSPGIQMETLAGNLARHLAGDIDFSGQPLARRLNLTVEKLNRMNYHAHWEAGAEGPRLLFRHCPYAAILDNHPELCVMDQALLTDLTGQSAEQTFRVGKEGSSVCLFLLGASTLDLLRSATGE